MDHQLAAADRRMWIGGGASTLGAYMRGLRNRLTALNGPRALNGLKALWSDHRAITAVEYGLIASAMAFVLVNIFLSLGTPISQIFVSLGTKI
jgi:Flp pilus assembly pilin Flp